MNCRKYNEFNKNREIWWCIREALIKKISIRFIPHVVFGFDETLSIKFIGMMIKEGSTKIVHFVAGVRMEGCGHISHFNDYRLSYTLSKYSTLVHIILREYNIAFLCHCWFLWILWWGCWYAYMSPSDKKSLESLILKWPVCYYNFRMNWPVILHRTGPRKGLYQINIRIVAIRTW